MSELAEVYVIEDDESVQLLIRTTLEEEGHTVRSSVSGKVGLEELLENPAAIVLLDLKLPDMDGLEVCRQLRSHTATASVPIVMISSLDSEEDRIRGFELGADDYVTKPVSYRELALRVRALLARSVGNESPKPVHEFTRGTLRLDLARRRAFIEEVPAELTATEFKLIEYLTSHEGRVVSRSELLEKVWGTNGSLTTRRVDTYVQRLRSKLGAMGEALHTHRGDGYRFEWDENSG